MTPWKAGCVAFVHRLRQAASLVAIAFKKLSVSCSGDLEEPLEAVAYNTRPD
jgi:hypothetical protein